MPLLNHPNDEATLCHMLNAFNMKQWQWQMLGLHVQECNAALTQHWENKHQTAMFQPDIRLNCQLFTLRFHIQSEIPSTPNNFTEVVGIPPITRDQRHFEPMLCEYVRGDYVTLISHKVCKLCLVLTSTERRSPCKSYPDVLMYSSQQGWS